MARDSWVKQNKGAANNSNYFGGAMSAMATPRVAINLDSELRKSVGGANYREEYQMYKGSSKKDQLNNSNIVYSQGIDQYVKPQKKQRKRSESLNSYSDGLKVALSGSSTRNEKNWESKVFGRPI